MAVKRKKNESTKNEKDDEQDTKEWESERIRLEKWRPGRRNFP